MIKLNRRETYKNKMSSSSRSFSMFSFTECCDVSADKRTEISYLSVSNAMNNMWTRTIKKMFDWAINRIFLEYEVVYYSLWTSSLDILLSPSRATKRVRLANMQEKILAKINIIPMIEQWAISEDMMSLWCAASGYRRRSIF